MVRPTSLAPAGIFLLAISLSTSATSAFAAWPHDPNNGNVALCTAANDQNPTTTVSDGAGGAIVAWYDYRSGTSYDIYAQRVSAAGVPLWAANGVAVCTAANHQYVPQGIPDGAGGVILVWYDYRGGNADIYAQRLNSAGVPQWAANGVALCTAAGDQNGPRLVSDGAGGAIVAWYDYRSGTNYDIYAQRVNAAGAPQWAANGVALSTAVNDQFSPVLASDGAGGAIVAWTDYRSGTSYDVYAQRVNATGAPQWAANGIAICTQPFDQNNAQIVSDGSGGAIITWQDLRNGANLDIYAQRVNAAGTTQWTPDGAPICQAGDMQQLEVIATDGSGGAIIAWDDRRYGPDDIFAQRVDAAGTPQWTSGGIPISTAAGDQGDPSIISDGAGGAIIAWDDPRDGNSDVYAQRVTGAGTTLWNYNGTPISTAVGSQAASTLVSDGSGGAILAWYDNRNTGANDVYAQRIERYGYLGNPEPSITGVKDTPNDQGGFVKVGWNASYLDVDPIAGIYEYRVWRSAPPNAARARAILARGVSQDPDEAANLGRFLSLPETATDYLWELVGRQQAFELPGYSMVAATTGDSVAAGNPRTAFMVEAGASSYTYSPHWFSAPDSGYSVDNLPPVVPAPFTGAYLAGATHLHWGENHEADLAGYRLYRGASSGFTPGPGNLISAQPDTGYADAGAAGSWYKLSAIDAHGNESLYAILGPNGTLDAPGAPATALYFAPPSPNPAGQEGTTLRFGLPAESYVTLTVFDQQGRRVRELTHGRLPAGEHGIRWDGRDDGGRMAASGVYFARLEAPGRALRVRLALLR